MGKFSSICNLTESDKYKANSELNESDELESRISSLRDKIKASDWFNQVFEERLDDKYLKRFLRVAKMDEDAAQERLRRMFALQKGTEFRFPFSQKFELLLFLWTYLVPPFLRMVKGFLVTTCKIPYKNGMKCSVISRLPQSKE